jgi:protein SCO1/2
MLARPRNVTPALALMLVALLTGCSGGGGSSSAGSPAVSTGPDSGFDGAPFPAGIAAPDFTLRDEEGGRVSLGEYRGRVVMLTFLYSTCGDTCIVIAQQIRGALDELESEHARLPVVLVVSADPAADTPAHVKPASAGARVFDEYAPVLLIDRSGLERVLFETEELTPEALSHDVGKLDGERSDP